MPRFDCLCASCSGITRSRLPVYPPARHLCYARSSPSSLSDTSRHIFSPKPQPPFHRHGPKKEREGGEKEKGCSSSLSPTFFLFSASLRCLQHLYEHDLTIVRPESSPSAPSTSPDSCARPLGNRTLQTPPGARQKEETCTNAVGAAACVLQDRPFGRTRSFFFASFF